MTALELNTGLESIDRAFAIAQEDLRSNIHPFKDGLLEAVSPVIMAGEGYDTPWTRDAAINVWNGAVLVHPQEARNTLLSVLDRRADQLIIGGEYWDAIIWTIGAWAFYLATGDQAFLRLAREATVNSLRHLEATEFTEELGLFRGPGVYADGVSAYPDIYARAKRGHSSILRWPAANPELVAATGFGLPMHALSTNCVYLRAYQLVEAMNKELGLPSNGELQTAERLRTAINARFWSDELGHYRYLVDPFGGCDAQEGFGHAFAILFGVADDRRRSSVLDRQHLTPAGIPCLWPSFARYRDDDDYGRHSGTVWPPIQAFWAEAAIRSGRSDLFRTELDRVAGRAVRDGQFYEIYHPDSGMPYGGRQEREGLGIDGWDPEPRQTWSATAILRMILTGVLGMRCGTDGLRFAPVVPVDAEGVELTGLVYRNQRIDVVVRGSGSTVAEKKINGEAADPLLPVNSISDQRIEILLREDERSK